jgi:hypothetical protein
MEENRPRRPGRRRPSPQERRLTREEWRQLDLLKGPRQRGIKLPPALEVRTHIAIADLLRVAAVHGWVWSHIPSGGRRSAITGALLKRMGLRKGLPDFLLISPTGVHHWLELKRGRAPMTEEQAEFGAAMTLRGVPWACARSFEAAKSTLKSWGALRTATDSPSIVPAQTQKAPRTRTNRVRGE